MDKSKEFSSGNSNGPKFGMRHVQVTLLFFMLAIASGTRIQLSIAIVAMNKNTTSPNPNIPTFDWNNKSVVLSAFYWGYLALQLVAGSLAKIYGAKLIMTGSMAANAIICAFIPIAAIQFGSYGVIVCRILQGVVQGCFYPAIYNMLGRWAPANERSRLGAFTLAGYSFGSVFGQVTAGYMSSSWWGWPSTFYLYGGLGLIWTLMWMIFGANTPAEHKRITEYEKRYIESSLGTTEDEKTANIPWKAIFTSKPVWALNIYSVGVELGSVALTAETPIYMDKILKFEIEGNSVLSSISSLACFLSCFAFGQLADYFINRDYLSRGATRKLFGSIHCLLSVFGLAILCVVPSGARFLSVLMFVIIGFSYGASNGGPGVNQIDLSPRFAGIILAITNTCSGISSALGPLAVQVMVTDESDKSQWKQFFYAAIAIYLLSNLAFVAFGAAELQSWDSYGTEQVEKNGSKTQKSNYYSTSKEHGELEERHSLVSEK